MRACFKFFLVLFLLLLSSCERNDYPPISDKVSLIATINIKSMDVSFVDSDHQKKIADWNLKKPYSGGLILPNGDTMILYGKQVDTVDLFSLKKGMQIDSWKTGKGIVNAKLLLNKKELVFADQSEHIIRYYSLDGKETKRIKTGENPLSILEDKEKRVYIVSFNFEQLTIIDGKEKKIVDRFPIHPSAAGALIKEKEHELWIGGHGEGQAIEENIHVYDSKTGRLKRKIAAPMMPVNFIEYNNSIFVLSHGSSTLYQMVEGKVVSSVKIGANPFEMKIFNEQLLVAGYDSDDLHFLEPYTLKQINKVKVGKGPFQILTREREVK